MASPLQTLRTEFKPVLPDSLKELRHLFAEPRNEEEKLEPQIRALFPKLGAQPASIVFLPSKKEFSHSPLKVGVVLSGGQAPGGHNVIAGLYDAIKKLNENSRLYGFLDGPKGIIEDKFLEITGEMLARFRNQGGFDLIGSGRTKIETQEQFKAAEVTVRRHDLDGLVIIGGDDSNTNGSLLAEFFIKNECKTSVVGVPKTIDGDLQSKEIEISFGFDTASKIYSEIIGNILRDAISAKKYYYFIKLMGRSASHITLECALQTHPNAALIGEEIAKEGKTLQDITNSICDIISERSKQGKEYGAILIPEGIIEFIPEFQKLIAELNKLLAEQTTVDQKNVVSQLSDDSLHCYENLPETIQEQLFLERDPHGNIQVSKIETERLFIEMVNKELNERKKRGTYRGKFSSQPIFCGYEGRSGMPSNFDANYCYALGHVAALSVNAKATGYICYVKNLAKNVHEWQIGARNLAYLITLETRNGKEKPVIAKTLVDLSGKPFAEFKKKRKSWEMEDDYRFPGPIQFFGPDELTDALTQTLQLGR